MASDLAPGQGPHVVVAGAGSVGCFVGCALAARGIAVTLLARPRVIDEVSAHGLALSDLDGGAARVPPGALAATDDPACLGRADLVLVCVKSGDTAAMARMIADHAPAAAPVVSLQNGVSNAGILEAALPGRDVRAGMVGFNVVALGEGRYHRATSGSIVVAPGLGGVAEMLCTPVLPVQPRADIREVQWGKLLINLNNAINALSGLTVMEMLHSRAWRRVMADQQAEALRVLRAAQIVPVPPNGVPPWLVPHVLRLPDPLFRRVARRMLQVDPTARASMSVDMMHNKRTEVDAFQGEIVAMGAAHGVETPVSAGVKAAVHVAERARAGLPGLDPVRFRSTLRS